jgi:hypothetical protein
VEETQDIVINGVSVITIADYAKRRHLKVPFVQNHLIKGDDQNDPIKPVYKLGNTGMYSIDELDEAYLVRGSKGITLASMGYLHPGKAAELESRIRELIQEKAEAETNLMDSETELEDVKAQLFRAQRDLEEGKKQYALLLKERDELAEELVLAEIENPR